MYIDNKFKPFLCPNVFNLNTYFGYRNCQKFWMHCKSIRTFYVQTYKLLWWLFSDIEEKWCFLQHNDSREKN